MRSEHVSNVNYAKYKNNNSHVTVFPDSDVRLARRLFDFFVFADLKKK